MGIIGFYNQSFNYQSEAEYKYDNFLGFKTQGLHLNGQNNGQMNGIIRFMIHQYLKEEGQVDNVQGRSN